MENLRKYYGAIKDSSKQIPIPGEFDKSGKLKMKNVFYHYPVDTSPSFLQI